MATMTCARKPGRPQKCQIDRFRTMAWYTSVEGRIHPFTSYAVEKHFNPDKFIYVRDKGMKRPCKFDKYKQGKHVPCDKLVDEIENEFKGTKEWLIHPLWEISKPPTLEVEKIYKLLAELKPSIKNLIFYSSPSPPYVSHRKHDNIEKLAEKLNKDSSWDALAACIGLIQEAKYLNNPGVHFFVSRTALTIFLRVASCYPMRFIALEYFEYLKKHFLPNKIDPRIDTILNSINVENEINYYHYLRLMIEDLYIQNNGLLASNTCLYFADKYLSNASLREIYTFKFNHDWKSVRRHPSIKKLTRAIRRWETSNEYEYSYP